MAPLVVPPFYSSHSPVLLLAAEDLDFDLCSNVQNRFIAKMWLLLAHAARFGHRFWPDSETWAMWSR